MSIAQWRGGSPLCSTCGQPHPCSEPHLYNYSQEVDDDLTCHICLQPLVSPTDTKCGHTFCRACLTNYLRIQPMCPIDRQPLTSSYDCQPASLMVRRLLDKLEVECPNFSLCQSKLARSELEAHLNHRCPGAIFPCLRACFGCTFQGNWQQLQLHTNECNFKEHTGDAFRAPILEGHISKIEIPRSSSSAVLGISIVGGYDSPLRCIIIQEIHFGGIIAKDGRLQAGDQLIEVNGKDLTHCPHNYVVNVLNTYTPTLQLSVYRELVDQTFGESHRVSTGLGLDLGGDIFRVVLDRQPGRSLGIRLTEKRHQPGVFISEVIEGSIVEQDGRMRPDDQILEINSQDIRRAKIEEASLLIQMCNRHVELLVARTNSAASNVIYSPPSPNSLNPGSDSDTVASMSPITTLDSPNRQQKTPPPLPPKVLPLTPLNLNSSIEMTPMHCHVRRLSRCSSDRSMQPKYFSLAKGSNESLGIRVAGGLESQQGNTPVYIQNIALQGCLGRSKLLKKGDILLSVNGTSLLGISHAEAVAALKVAASAVSLTLGIIEGPETCDGAELFTPTWMYWHKLPRSLHLTRTITLHRTSNESLGFSLVGGKDSFQSNQSFHVLLVVRESIAAKEGKLRCGDQILSVNGHRLDGLRHAEAVNLLKQTRTKVLLEILSWPGTIV